MPSNKFGLNPVKVINFFAYGQKSPYYGKIKLRLNYCPFNEGEQIDIDTDKIRLTGVLERKYEGSIIMVKIEKFLYKEAVN